MGTKSAFFLSERAIHSEMERTNFDQTTLMRAEPAGPERGWVYHCIRCNVDVVDEDALFTHYLKVHQHEEMENISSEDDPAKAKPSDNGGDIIWNDSSLNVKSKSTILIDEELEIQHQKESPVSNPLYANDEGSDDSDWSTTCNIGQSEEECQLQQQTAVDDSSDNDDSECPPVLERETQQQPLIDVKSDRPIPVLKRKRKTRNNDERALWCKVCDDYFTNIFELKAHVKEDHHLDASKVNRYNYCTWDLEISRSLVSPGEEEIKKWMEMESE